jgi:hypothetical protein
MGRRRIKPEAERISLFPLDSVTEILDEGALIASFSYPCFDIA